MKPVRFIGSAKQDPSALPEQARSRAGYEIFMVQGGRDPADWKPLVGVGADLELAARRYKIAREHSEGSSHGEEAGD